MCHPCVMPQHVETTRLLGRERWFTLLHGVQSRRPRWILVQSCKPQAFQGVAGIAVRFVCLQSKLRQSAPRKGTKPHPLGAPPHRRFVAASRALSAPGRRLEGTLPAPWSSSRRPLGAVELLPAPSRRPPLPAHPPPAPPSRTRQVAHDVCHTPSNKPCNPPNPSNDQKTCKPPVLPVDHDTRHLPPDHWTDV